MEVTTHFIPQNVAAPNTHQIGVYHKGKKVGYIPLNSLAYPDTGRKRYSFGALSDIHLGNTDADTDFRRALTYFNDVEKVDFTCICGDMTNYGKISEYQHYKDMVDTYSPNTKVYAIAGNHDAADNDTSYKTEPALTLTNDGITPYTGNPLFYTFAHGNDLFVMMGLRRWTYGQANADIFSTEELQWLYDTLEANRDKRCFVWQHALRFDGCGKPYSGHPTNNLLTSTHGTVFKSLVSHYPNVVWFHGHSHTCFDSQEDNAKANYEKDFGCHSIHIPSLAKPREYENSGYVSMTAESEGYVVDVYENHIVLRGRDFAAGKFLPFAQYCLDTSFQVVEAGTYTDTTGTIVT